jgi:hypothetical protein
MVLRDLSAKRIPVVPMRGLYPFPSLTARLKSLPPRSDHLLTLDLAVVGRFSHRRPCRKN